MIMKLIKKINNNYALALDSKGEKIIVEGKGIGFNKMPCEISDLSQISRTYYNTKEQDISLIQSVTDEVLDISNQIFEYANSKIAEKLNPNLAFILADHIQFSIERFQTGIDIKMPIYYDVKHLYPKESGIADYAMKLIRERLDIHLPDSEKTGIALVIINSEVKINFEIVTNHDVIELCIAIIEKYMRIKVHRDSFSYSRFVTHFEYLLRRASNPSDVSSDNLILFSTVSKNSPEILECVEEINALFNKRNLFLNEEEKLYLILHISRLCNYSDC